MTTSAARFPFSLFSLSQFGVISHNSQAKSNWLKWYRAAGYGCDVKRGLNWKLKMVDARLRPGIMVCCAGFKDLLSLLTIFTQ